MYYTSYIRVFLFPPVLTCIDDESLNINFCHQSSLDMVVRAAHSILIKIYGEVIPGEFSTSDKRFYINIILDGLWS